MPNKPFLLKPHSEATKSLNLKVGPQRIRIDDILLREHDDSRPLNAKHVLELAESIVVLGLLEPLVIDTRGQLLAGGHRLAALQLLAFSGDEEEEQREKFFIERAEDPTVQTSAAWDKLIERVKRLSFRPARDPHLVDGVPVLVMDLGKNSDGADRRALAIELAENNVRRSYTADEIKELAARLKKAGYKATPGRPKEGEVPAINVLHAAVGKSKRTIERIISDKKPGSKSAWDNARNAFRRAAQGIIASGGRQQSPDAKKLQGLAEKALAILDEGDGLG